MAIPYGLIQPSGVAFTGERAHLLPLTIPTLGVTGIKYDWDARSIVMNPGQTVNGWETTDAGHVIAGSGNKPKFRREANGAPYVEFTAANQETLAEVIARTAINTLIFAVRPRTVPASGNTQAILGAAGDTARTIVRYMADQTIQMGDGGVFTAGLPAPAGQWAYGIAMWNGASSVLNVNGEEATVSLGSTAAGFLSFARFASGTYGDMDFKRVAYAERSYTEAERKTIMNALTTQFTY